MKDIGKKGAGIPSGTGDPVPAAEPAAAPEQAPVQQLRETAQHRIVVCAYEGSEGQMAKVWEKMTGEKPLVILAPPSAAILDILPSVVAMPEVADEFVLAPANCVPCAPIPFAELGVPTAYVERSGTRRYRSGLPILFSKAHLVDALPGDGDVPGSEEEFLEGCIKYRRTRPVDVGYSFGNYVTPVVRGNPCENIVIEAFVRKKFITASPEGYKAVAALIDQYLLG